MLIRASVLATAGLVAALIAMAPTNPALAHHCGSYGTHTPSGWCLKTIRNPWIVRGTQPSALGLSTQGRARGR